LRNVDGRVVLREGMPVIEAEGRRRDEQDTWAQMEEGEGKTKNGEQDERATLPPPYIHVRCSITIASAGILVVNCLFGAAPA